MLICETQEILVLEFNVDKGKLTVLTFSVLFSKKETMKSHLDTMIFCFSILRNFFKY